MKRSLVALVSLVAGLALCGPVLAKDYVRIFTVAGTSAYLDPDSIARIDSAITRATVVGIDQGSVSEVRVYLNCAQRQGAVKGVTQYDETGQVVQNADVPDDELDYSPDSDNMSRVLLELVCDAVPSLPDEIVSADDRMALRDKVMAAERTRE